MTGASRRLRLVCALGGLGVAGCGAGEGDARSGPDGSAAQRAEAGDGPPWFVEEAAARGLVFQHTSGATGRHLFPEIMGGGAALFDMDGDGDLDAYLVQSGSLLRDGPPAVNRLFANDGTGHFQDVGAGSGAEDPGYGMGVAAGDYDGDGDVDLYVTNWGRNTLLRNEGGGRFTDVTDAAGVGDPGWSTSATFLDYDVDGDLDLYVCNYVAWTVESEIPCQNASGERNYCSPNSYHAPAPDTLYRNRGDGTFADVSQAAGLRVAFGNGLGVVAADFDENGRPDLFVANDQMVNQLWSGRPDGTFDESGMLAGVALDQHGTAKACMGTATADVDQDGDLDLLVVNLRGESDSFYRNEGTHFVDATARVKLGTVSRSYTRFGMGFQDFDDDGYLDLYLACGRVRREPGLGGVADPYAEPNLLLRGAPGPTFAEVLPRGGTAQALVHTSRGAAFGDVDDDGGIDVLVVNRDAPAYLLMNRVPARGHWILFRVLDRAGSDAVGASVRIVAEGKPRRGDVNPGYSYVSSNDPRVHFGLGSVARVEDVRVRWPDGQVEGFGPREVDRVVVLQRGDGAR